MAQPEEDTTSSKPLNSHYDEDPARYDSLRESWMSERREVLLADFLTGTPPGSRVLEIGSGTGRLLIALATARPDLEFIGIEPLPKYVAYARELVRTTGHANIQVIQGAADESSGLDVGLIDRVISVDVLHHVDVLSRSIANVTAATEAGARWLVMEPNPLNLYMFAFCLLTNGERNFWPRRFERAARERGWRELDRTRRFVIPASVKQPKPWMKQVEARVERVPLAGRAVKMTFECSADRA